MLIFVKNQLVGRQKKGILRYFLFFAALIIGIGAVLGFRYYRFIYLNNINLDKNAQAYLYIPTGSEYADVLDSLEKRDLLKNKKAFDWVAERKSYPELIKPGRFLIEAGMNNNELINRLRIGDQVPVQVLIKSARTKEDFAQQIAAQIELNADSLLSAMNQPAIYNKYGFDAENFLTMFLPNTYEMHWNTQTAEFIQRMAKEFKKFWTEERKTKARQQGLSQSEAYILASIVQQETSRRDEMPKVAGVYINRLKRGMPLQADPTLIFALGDFTIKRVLNEHKSIASRYNTYKYKGLPPGPIYMPNTYTIDAVLDAEEHNYLYFCAKPDFSGYHQFASSYSQHMRNARAYHRALNQRRIYK